MCAVSCTGYLLIDVESLIYYAFLANFPTVINSNNGKPPVTKLELIGWYNFIIILHSNLDCPSVSEVTFKNLVIENHISLQRSII